MYSFKSFNENKKSSQIYWNDVLLDGAISNDIGKIRSAIKNNADIDVKDEYGYTALFTSCLKGILENVKYLVENGANVNIKNFFDDTPLMKACYRGHLNIVKYLIKKVADIFIVNDYGKNALSIAKNENNEEIVDFLCDYILENYPNKADEIKEYVSDEIKKKHSYLFRSKSTGLWDLKKESLDIHQFKMEINYIITKQITNYILDNNLDPRTSLYRSYIDDDLKLEITVNKNISYGVIYDALKKVEELSYVESVEILSSIEVNKDIRKYEFQIYFYTYLTRSHKTGLWDLKKESKEIIIIVANNVKIRKIIHDKLQDYKYTLFDLRKPGDKDVFRRKISISRNCIKLSKLKTVMTDIVDDIKKIDIVDTVLYDIKDKKNDYINYRVEIEVVYKKHILRGVKTGLWDLKKENISSAFIEDVIENIVKKVLNHLVETDIDYSIFYHEEGPGDVNFTIQIEEIPGGEVYQDELKEKMYEIEDMFLDNEYIHGLIMKVDQKNIEYGQYFECEFVLFLVQEIKRANKTGLLDIKN